MLVNVDGRQAVLVQEEADLLQVARRRWF